VNKDIVSERVRTTIALGLCQIYEVDTSDFMRAARSMRALQDEVERVIVTALTDPATLACLGALRRHDDYFFVHALDSTVVALMIGRALFLPPEQLVRLAMGCLLHDVGMTRVDRQHWDHPGELTAEGRFLVNQHPQWGYEALRELRPDRPVENSVALQHHERTDGSGYPRGLRGTNVATRGYLPRSLPGRILADAEIVAVADVYDALISDRPWRQALLPDVVVRTLRQLAGTQLNANLVELLLTMVPPYPLGAPVIVARGKHLYHRGVVIRVHPGAFDRPTILLVQDARLEPIERVDVDLRETDDVIACIPPPGHDPVVEMTPEAEASLRAASGRTPGRPQSPSQDRRTP
jgi:HD-GYP domain-containing protein (c-di-GMP phosphodiesterase class II)